MTKIKYVKKKLKGMWGQTIYPEKKGEPTIIQVNIKRHKTVPFKKKQTFHEALADTIYHETLHAKHPKMHEKTVRKLTAKKMGNIKPHEVKKLISKIK